MRRLFFLYILVASNLTTGCVSTLPQSNSTNHLHKYAKSEEVDIVFSELQQVQLTAHQNKVELELLQEKLQEQEKKIHQLHQIQESSHKSFQSHINEIKIQWQQSLSFQENASKDLKQFQATYNAFEQTVEKIQRHIQTLQKEIKERDERLHSLKLQLDMAVKLLQENEKTPGKIHDVKSGETLDKIAKIYGISTDRLRQYNHLQTDRIIVGQKLQIPS